MPTRKEINERQSFRKSFTDKERKICKELVSIVSETFYIDKGERTILEDKFLKVLGNIN